MKKAKSPENKISLSLPQLIIGAIVIIVLSSLAVYYFSHKGEASRGLQQFGKEGKGEGGDTPALTSAYTNSDYGFSLKLPEGFKPRESKTGDVSTIVLENDKAEGIQIVISPYDEKDLEVVDGVRMLTKDMILRDIPDMQVTEEQPLEIGKNYRGLAFKSNNDAFDGNSREVWFVFKGHLFQISTFLKFDGLLRDLFTSWQFK